MSDNDQEVAPAISKYFTKKAGHSTAKPVNVAEHVEEVDTNRRKTIVLNKIAKQEMKDEVMDYRI